MSCAAAEEHRRVLGAERGETAERRALHLDRPAHHAAARHLVGDPFAQQLFQLRFEIVLRGVGIECRLEVAALGQEPFLEEALEHLPVVLDPRPVRVFDRHRGRRAREAEDIDVREAVPPFCRFSIAVRIS